MDPAQISRCDNDWTTSLVVISILSVISAVTVLLRVWTNIVIWRMARAGGRPFTLPKPDARRFTLTDYLLFAGYVSPHLYLGFSVTID